MTLKSFPRGGKKVKCKPLYGSLFDKKAKTVIKPKRGIKKADDDAFNKDENFMATSAQCLSYSTLSQGMVILGRIQEAREYHLQVSLPGRLNGRLQITDVSASYTKLLQKIVSKKEEQPDEYRPLTEIYKPGDYVICYVKELHPSKKHRVSLSLEPELVNQNLDHSRLAKRSKLVCTISSAEEHGYLVDTGIANLRAFLPYSDVNEGRQYFPGRQIFCAITDVKTMENASTVKVSTKAKHTMSVLSYESQSLDILVPGTKFSLNVTEILSNGLQVSFNGDGIGYINQIYLKSPLASYAKGMEVIGTLLYVMPIVKFAYFSPLSEDVEKSKLNIGDVLPSARVVCRESNGIFVTLSKNLRGIIPLRRTEVDFEKINTTFLPGSEVKCRVLNYECMDRIYICTMQRHLLEHKFFSHVSFTPGDVTDAEITKIDLENEFVSVTIHRSIGYVPPEHISDVGRNIIDKLKVGQSIKVRILRIDEERKRLVLTMKRSLIESNLPPLYEFEDAKVGARHHGTIIQVTERGLLIQLFGNLKGWLPLYKSNKFSVERTFSFGQVLVVEVKNVDKANNKLMLQIAEESAEQKTALRIGQLVTGTIADASAEGLEVNVIDEDNSKATIRGFLPAGHMAPSIDLGRLLATRHVPGDEISAMVFATTPNLILTKSFAPQKRYTKFERLKAGDCIPCSILEITEIELKVLLPIESKEPALGIVARKEVTNFEAVYVNQVLFGKILSLDKKTRTVHLTTALSKIWVDAVKRNADTTASIDVLTLYLDKVEELSQHAYYQSHAISSVKVGQRVTGNVEKVTDHGLVLKLNNGTKGTVRKDHYTGSVKQGDKVSGTVLWVNYVHEIVELTMKSIVMNAVRAKQTSLPVMATGTLLRGEIVFVTNWFFLVLLRGSGKGTLVALPVRRHLNDLEPDLSPYVLGSKVKCYFALNKRDSSIFPICVIKSALEVPKISQAKNAIAVKTKGSKRKNETSKKSEEGPLAKISKTERMFEETKGNKPAAKGTKRKKTLNETGVDNEIFKDTAECGKEIKPEKMKKKELSKVEEKAESSSKEVNKETRPHRVKNKVDKDLHTRNVKIAEDKPATKDDAKMDNKTSTEDETRLPECGFYWDTLPSLTPAEESSSDSEEDEELLLQSKKKKKLSAAERRELERQKEREIREREEALASNDTPNSVDQFDRLVLASPDSSLVWLQYMAYHLQATEIEKARAVARRAVKTINFREENERLNVWRAWLNFESRFGTPESLNEVFQEAVRMNDALQVYTHMLTIHAEAGRQAELEKIVNTVIGKFKGDPQTWIDCGLALLKIGLKDKSRLTMKRALQSLQAHQHVSLMVKFAQMENKFGDKERAQTLFEQILSSYPKRVDVWSSYVDILTKSGDIEIARKVLERAVAQSLPARKMKTLFKKFISFEESLGNTEGAANIKQMAIDYVENRCNK